MSHAVFDAIELELARLRVTPAEAGEADSLGVNDEAEGWSSLGSSESRHDLYWYGKAEELLERLRKLPDACGHEAVRAEFRSHFPG